MASGEIASIYSQGLAGTNIGSIGPKPVLTVTSDINPDDYSWVCVAQPTSFTITLENTGLFTLNIGANQAINGADAGEFAFDSSYDETSAKILQPGQSIDIPILWDPAATGGQRVATLDFTHDDTSAASPAMIPLNPRLVSRATQAATIATSIVIRYEFEETSGNVVSDSSGSTNVNDGSVVGSGMSATSVEGIIGNAYHALGTSTDFIAIDTTADNQYTSNSISDALFGDAASGTDFTISSWINLTAFGTIEGFFGNADLGELADDRSGFVFFLGSSGDVQIRAHSLGPDPDDNFNLGVQGFLNPGTWQHWTFTIDRDGDHRLYVDGQLVASQAMDGTGAIGQLTKVFLIGARLSGDGNPLINGSDAAYDDFAIWHRALDAWEVEYIYDNGATLGIGLTASPLATDYVVTQDPADDPQAFNSPLTATVTYTITGAGLGETTVGSFATAGSGLGEFTITGLPTTDTLLCFGETVEITVEWTPDNSTAGIRDAQITFTSDSADGNDLSVIDLGYEVSGLLRVRQDWAIYE